MNAGCLTIREALLQASSFLQEGQVEEYRFEAELLLTHILGWSRGELLLRWQELFPEALLPVWESVLRRRAAGEPTAYILGEQEFYGLPFQVTPDVLIPRPETELLVEEMVRLGKVYEQQLQRPPVLADIGTGSGAIAVTAAVQCPGWQAHAVDVSPEALAVASANARRHGADGRIRFHKGDMLEPLIRGRLEVDVLVSNPPYIPAHELPGLQREVRDHEPRGALDGGEDGLFFYRKLASQVRLLPRIPAVIGFEVGMGQAEAVAGLVREAGCWERVGILRDLAGIDRIVTGTNIKIIDS